MGTRATVTRGAAARLALPLAIGVVTWEHALHTRLLRDGTPLPDHARHVAVDTVLAVPLAITAAVAALCLARKHRTRALLAAAISDHTGRYVLHCHVLEHEDRAMMAQFEVAA